MSENQIGNPASVLITGCSRGIGKAMAEAFAAAGYRLYLNCRNHVSELEDFAVSLSETHQISATVLPGDVGDYEQVREMFRHIPSLDVLINNAGVAHIGLLQDMKPEEWRCLMQTNLDSLYNTCSQAIPLMQHAGSGRILNITSIWGDRGASCEVAYSASKGGVNAFTKALARELAPSGIPVNAISCGVIDTDMNRSHLTPEDLSSLEEEIPMGRMGTPQEVAQLACKLVTAPSYMTGQIITLAGGFED